METKNKTIFQFLRIVDAETELLVRRIRFYQQVAKTPENHVQILAAWFGDSRMDQIVGIKRMDDDGNTNENSTPWAQRFVIDMHNF